MKNLWIRRLSAPAWRVERPRRSLLSLPSSIRIEKIRLPKRRRLSSQATSRELGLAGEREAERFLKKIGLRIIKRSQADRLGEIDIVAIDLNQIVFVEIKTRRYDSLAAIAEVVDKQKRRRIVRSARYFLGSRRISGCSYRYDIVAIAWPYPCATIGLQYFPSAFREEEAETREA